MTSMNKNPRRNQRVRGNGRRIAGQAVLLLVLVGMIAGYFAVLASAQNSYTITDGDTTTVLSSASQDVSQVLAQAGIAVKADDRITTTAKDTTTEILIERRQNVTAVCGGEEYQADTYQSTVGQVLEEMDITLSEQDVMLSKGQVITPEERVYDGMSIAITKKDQQTVTVTETIPYESVTFQDPTLPIGQETVKTPGAEGQQEIVYLQKYVDGQLTESTVLSTRLITAPVTEVILVGSGGQTPPPEETESPVEVATEPEPSPEAEPTPEPSPEPEPEPEPSYDPEPEPSQESETKSSYYDWYEEPEYEEEPSYYEPEYEEPQAPAYSAPSVSGSTITTSTGEVISYSDVLYVEATAYTGGGITATGTSARYGAIAVDPSVIPYGT